MLIELEDSKRKLEWAISPPTFSKVQVTKEHASKNGVPEKLVDGYLRCDGDRFGPRHLAIKESIKVVTSGSMKEKAKRSQADCTHL